MSANFNPAMSTDEISVGTNSNLCLTDYLDELESDVSNKAASNHSHTDLESAIEGLEDGKAEAVHGHEMSSITGLSDKLTEIDSAIAALQGDSGSTVAPVLVASMHLGKLDNNSGAENSSSTRICSDPFAVEPGKSYYQVNDKGVNMYVLIYDADELFLGYLGSFASGAEIPVTNPNAAYMRLGSLLGEYDLTNEFRIYDVDPESGGDTVMEVYTCDEADARFAPNDHTHDNDHAHANKAVLDGITAEKVAAWDSGTGASGSDGADGADGEDGGYYSITVTQPTANTMKLSFAPSKEGMPAIADQTVTLPAGENGEAGVSPDVSVSTISGGHRITITSASGSVSFDVMDGEDGADGQNGADGDDFSGSLASDILRLNGTQALFKTSTMMTLATNNLETMIAGSKIYSKVTISVSSDERLKENIEAVDPGKCADFINGIDVKTFNYIGNDTPCMGVIAQDVQKGELAKFFVSEMACPEKYLTVKAADLVFPLIVTVQELARKVAELEANR